MFTRLGQEFTPTLDEKNIVMEVKRIPSTSLSQSQSMQLANENMAGRFPQVAFVFSRTGTPDLAADPMPPSASDTYIILKPRDQWPDPNLSKEDLIHELDTEASKLPGNKIGFSQPIQMRFNELIAGVREDLAVKVFGDEFGPMLRAAGQIASILRGVEGAKNVKIEEVAGLPFLDIRIDKGEIARRGLSLSDVQDVIGIAIGGRAAGLVFEGDRRFQIIVRLADAVRSDVDTLENLPVSAAARRPRDRIADHPIAPTRHLPLLGRAEPDQSGERQAPRRRDRRGAWARYRLSGRGGAKKRSQSRSPCRRAIG